MNPARHAHTAHTALIEYGNRRLDGSIRTATITWKDQIWKCCPSEPAHVLRDAIPVYVENIRSPLAEIRGRVVQCGGCGALHGWIYNHKDCIK